MLPFKKRLKLSNLPFSILGNPLSSLRFDEMAQDTMLVSFLFEIFSVSKAACKSFVCAALVNHSQPLGSKFNREAKGDLYERSQTTEIRNSIPGKCD